MIISKINNVSFGKFYIKDADYSSAQSQYLCDINSKLNQNNGKDGSYADKIEKYGYDVCARPSFHDNTVQLYLTKADKYSKDPTRKLTMATLGDYTTNFNPEIGVFVAEASKKTDTILKHFLLTLAATLAIFAGVKACSEKAVKSTVTTVTESVKSHMNTTAANIRTLNLK